MRHSTDQGGNQSRPTGNAYPLPITNFSAPWTNRSGAIAVDATSQLLMAANPDRRDFTFQNISDQTLGIGIGQAATLEQPSMLIAAGQSWEPTIPPNQALYVIGATNGKAFTCWEC